MRNAFLAVTLLSALGLQTAGAVESEWQITPRGFFSDLDVKRQYTGVNGAHTDADLGGIGVGVGYLSPVGIVAAIGGDIGGEFDVYGAFDSYTFDQRFVAVGYQFELGNGWRFVPMVGRARWRLEAEEGAFLNPGVERSSVIEGYDYYWEASVSRRISRAVALGVSYKQGDYQFGQSRAAAFIVTIGL